MRRRGIAKALLDYACQYAEKAGYDYIEGYPSWEKFSINDCGGSLEMHVNKGFDIIEIPNGLITRKKKSKWCYVQMN